MSAQRADPAQRARPHPAPPAHHRAMVDVFASAEDFVSIAPLRPGELPELQAVCDYLKRNNAYHSKAVRPPPHHTHARTRTPARSRACAADQVPGEPARRRVLEGQRAAVRAHGAAARVRRAARGHGEDAGPAAQAGAHHHRGGSLRARQPARGRHPGHRDDAVGGCWFARPSRTPAPTRPVPAPQLVQAVRKHDDSELLQLPHFTAEEAAHCRSGSRKSGVGWTLRQFVNKAVEERKGIRDMTEQQQQEVHTVCDLLPMVELQVRVHPAHPRRRRLARARRRACAHALSLLAVRRAARSWRTRM